MSLRPYMKCYLCKSPAQPFIVKNGYAIFHCHSCGLYETDLKKNYESFVKEFYGKGYFTGDPKRMAYASYKRDKLYIARNMHNLMLKVKQYKKNGKLLEAGCAYGYFLELALREGYDAYGFDPSAHAVAEAQKHVGKQRVKKGTIGSIQYPAETFDVIALFDVFEHLSDPRKDIQKLVSMLADDGILVIATGDTRSVMARILKRRWTFFNPPQHLFFFNQSNLTAFLRQLGLTPLEWFRIGKWLSIEYVLHLAETGAESVAGKVLHRIIGHTFLGRIPIYLSVRDNMVVIAKKAI